MSTTIHKESFLRPFNFQQWLLVSCGFSFSLLCARVVATGYFTYVFLIWNLFLAFIPYFISSWLQANLRSVAGKFKFAALVFTWLLFIPNAFYILTDLFHLEHIASAPKWFDLLLLLSFAWNGLVLGVASLRMMETILYRMSGRSFSLAIVFVVMWLNAFGIYIVRFLRFNSWDIITQPLALVNDMLSVLLHPIANKMEWGMISCYAIFMTLLYITIRELSITFNQINKSNQ